MTFNYPNGQEYRPQMLAQRKLHVSSQSRRGMSLEADINAANEYYRTQKIAVIYKKPTPVQIVDVDYPARAAARITKAFFRQPSTTDYNGVYQGHYIDFDAKETNNLESFPLKNVHDHQVKHLKAITEQAGLAFMIIRFTRRRETYVIWADLLLEFWQNQLTGRKSIPYSTIVKFGALVPDKLQPTTPYLEAVDLLMQTKKES